MKVVNELSIRTKNKRVLVAKIKTDTETTNFLIEIHRVAQKQFHCESYTLRGNLQIGSILLSRETAEQIQHLLTQILTN